MSITRHPKLYKRTATGAVQLWFLEQDGGKYRSVSGKVDGKLIVAAWTTAVPMNVGRSNATDAVSQAAAEISSHYAKKRREGYQLSIKEAARDTTFRPMLAHPYKDYADRLVDYCYMQPKLDGARCLMPAPGSMLSRKNTEIVSCPHIESAFHNILQLNRIIPDGELYNHEYRFDFPKLMSLIRKTKPTAKELEKTRDKVQYHIYDIFLVDRPEATFSERYEVFSDVVAAIGLDCIVPVPTFKVSMAPGCAEHIEIYEHFLELGYEGAIYRVDAPYEQKRTDKLLKRKEVEDAECIVLDVEPGRGKSANLAASVLCRHPNGKEFRATVKGPAEYRISVLKNKKKYIGGEATVEYFHLSPDGIPRFPRTKLFYGGKRDI